MADYGNAIEEAVYSLSSFQSNLFVGGDMSYDWIYQADITQPRNFIRHMCPPPPFGSNAVAPFPEARTRASGPSLWNFKARFRSPLKGRDVPPCPIQCGTDIAGDNCGDADVQLGNSDSHWKGRKVSGEVKRYLTVRRDKPACSRECESLTGKE